MNKAPSTGAPERPFWGAVPRHPELGGGRAGRATKLRRRNPGQHSGHEQPTGAPTRARGPLWPRRAPGSLTFHPRRRCSTWGPPRCPRRVGTEDTRLRAPAGLRAAGLATAGARTGRAGVPCNLALGQSAAETDRSSPQSFREAPIRGRSPKRGPRPKPGSALGHSSASRLQLRSYEGSGAEQS